MARQLHGFLKRKLGPVGLHMQAIWQRTLLSSALLKQAFTVYPGNAANCPTAKRDEQYLQEAPLPVVSPGTRGEHPAPLDSIAIVMPLDNSSTAKARMMGLSRAQPDVSTSTQTESSTLPDVHMSESSDSEHDSEIDDHSEPEQDPPSRRNSVRTHSEAASRDHLEQPEIRHGASHIVTADFEGKSHLAILVTRDMIEYLDDISAEKRKLERCEWNLGEAQREIDLDEYNMKYAESQIENASSQAEVDRIQENIVSYRSNIEKYTVRRDALEPDVERLKRNVAYFSALCQSSLRDVLTNGGFLKTCDELTENESFHAEESGSQSADGQMELCHDEERFSQSEVSLSERNWRAADEEVRERYNEFLVAERDFENRHQLLAEQSARYHQEVLDGACTMAQTEFDHIGLEANQMLTRNLRVAEELYEEALSRRNKFGHVECDQESGFVDDDYDGYPLSWDDEAVASAPSDFIHDWLQSIPEVDNFPDIKDLVQGAGKEFGQKESQEDIDACEIRSAQMSDTFSCNDLTRNRRRIDRWNKICGRVR
ncbi:MAG: hypothetical protein LQ350_001934 [Teloschistes chrysophthalmus]|nr:MAG: hypothetical protein LQ350_001934 [Niorma chrysophthalma]